MSTKASQITGVAIVYLTVFQTQIKENIKASCHWPLWGEFTGGRWIPRPKGQQRGKCFHCMTSSWALCISSVLSFFKSCHGKVIGCCEEFLDWISKYRLWICILGTFLFWQLPQMCMVTSSNGNIFCVTTFVRGIHRSVIWSFKFSLICACTNGWSNNQYAANISRHRTHYDVIVMYEITRH